MKKLLAVGSISLCIGLVGCLGSGDTIVNPVETTRQIHVVGRATVETAPDIATAQLGVQTFNASLDEAMAENSSRTSGAIEALRNGGVAEADIQTTSFYVQPQRDYSKEDGIGEIVGYWVNNTVSVTVRDLTRLGDLLQAAISGGANNVNSLAFTLDDYEAVYEQVRIEAMEDARQRAETLAEAAGVELGKPLHIDETSYGGGPIYGRGAFDEAAADGAPVPVAPGELEVSVQVDVVYEIR